MNYFPFAAFSLAVLALLPHSLLAAPPAASALPPDVPAHHWAAGSVGRMEHQHILGLEPDGRFRGDKPVTRYELAVALDRFVKRILRRPISRFMQKSFTQPSHCPLTRSCAFPMRPQLPCTHSSTSSSQGFLPPDTPGSDEKWLSTRERRKEPADALAAVTIRLSDRAEAPQKQ